MKIGISARGLSEVSGGAKQYIESVTRAILQIDQRNQYFIFHSSREFAGKFPNATEIFIDVKNKLWWDYVKLPRALSDNKIDICIFPKNVVPFNVRCKSIVIIHDLLHIKDPGVYKWRDSLYMRLFIPVSVRKSDAIITVSENTKKDLISLINVRSNKIRVIHEAADDKYRLANNSKEEKNKILRKYNIEAPYILYVGSISPRKNISRLIRAFEKVAANTEINMRLVLAGGKSWKDGEVHRFIDKSSFRSKIVLTGFVDDNDLPTLYNQARVFVYPSLYEGFGLPILEAMACGCPVITSNTSSLPEVAGDAAVYFDPTNENELAKWIHELINNDLLRNGIIAKGFERVKEFSWKKTAQSICSIYKEI